MKYPASLIALGVLIAFCSRTTAQDYKEGDRTGQGPSVEDTRLVSTSATVEAIDQKTRMVTLKGPQGNSFTFKVDDRVKNLGKVKVGDKVVVDYIESLAMTVVKPGDSKDEKETVVERAEPGKEPGGVAAEKLTVTATIERIDRSTPSITLRGPDGNLVTFMVRHPERLKLVKVGDTLKITYERAIAVAIEPAKAAH